MLKHLDTNGIIPANQHGFVKGRSTETNLLECLNDWTTYLDDKKACDVVYFDFSKAFDKVDHSKLLLKLRRLKFHPVVCSWIENYLFQRTFQVRIRSVFSKIKEVRSGVPQGSVLSPILFAIYTAELPELLEGCGVVCKQFADDIKVYRKVDSIEDISSIQSSLESILKWSELWCLPLAPEKTVFMRIGGSTLPRAYKLREHCLNEVSAVRDLGFHYNNKLSFSDHYEAIVRKATFRTYQIFKGLTVKDEKVLIKAYKTYVRPIVESGASIFCPWKKKDVDLLEKVQDNYTRKLCIRTGEAVFSDVPHPSSRNQKFKLHSLKSRRKVYDVCMVFKLLTGIARVDESRFFTRNVSRTRGSSVKISYATPRTNLKLHSFNCRAGSTFISLKSQVVLLSPAYMHFKRLVKKELLSFI